jgi:Spy/CpxP family protein refolding chaperone
MAVLVLALATLVGALGGIAFDRLVLLPRMFHRPGFEHGMRRPQPRDREFRNRFARELGLTPEQQTRIDTIMDRQGRELRAVRGRVQPQLDSIIQRTRNELDAVLTPDQREKAAEIRRRHPRPPRPRSDEASPAEGPPPRSPPR